MNTGMTTLKSLHIQGFKSIHDAELHFGARTLLIGPNGAGKSNLLTALSILPMLASKSLGLFSQRAGGASSLFYRGPKATSEIKLQAEFQRAEGRFGYDCEVIRTADDGLLVLTETVASHTDRGSQSHGSISHNRESLLPFYDNPSSKVIYECFQKINTFHFHDTSVDAALRTPSRKEDSKFLRPDGSNLAAYIWSLMQSETDEDRAAWRRIDGLIKQIAPFIKEISPTVIGDKTVRLDWIDEFDEVYGPHQLSDGTLRAIALIVCLAQASKRLPSFISIDEPELGLHPAALDILCGIIRSLEGRCQVLLATQSTELLDYFEPNEVVVVERQTPGPPAASGQGTSFRRLDTTSLSEWLAEYSLSALYKRNLLGGRP